MRERTALVARGGGEKALERLLPLQKNDFVGIFRAIERPTYEDMMTEQIDAAIAKSGPGSLEKLINSGDTWVVE